MAGVDGEALLTGVCTACEAVVNLSLVTRGRAAIEAAVGAASDRANGLVELYQRSFELAVEEKGRALDDLLRSLPLRARGRFCDFGCGAALDAVAATRRFDVVQAVDLTLINARATLAFARDCGYRPFAVERVMDATPDGFDLILARQVVQHLADAPATLSDLAAALRPGGLLVVEAPVFDPAHMTAATTFLPGSSGLASTLRRRGLRIVDSTVDDKAGVERILARAAEEGARA